MQRLLRFVLPMLALCLVPLSAAAQYLYLDTDGDGLSTAGDVVNPSGSTTLDVWIRTDTNRDGSAATCVSDDGDLTINSYEFILRATGGTVAWSGFTNHRPEFSVNLGHGESATDYHNGLGGGVPLPPGTYRLASVDVTVTLGSPSIEIASSTPLSGVFLTSFGSRCSGSDFDFTLKLGTDWFDADGVPYGGAQNQPPVLTPPVDMTVAEGAVAEQALLASDLEGQPITFALVSGPSYATVTTTDPGSGQAGGLLRLTPGLQDAGTTPATVSASDALLTDSRSITITVTDVNTAPSLSPPSDVTIVEGQFLHQTLTASDAEFDPLQFTLVSGPVYVTVAMSGFSTARLSIAPTFADAGERDATVQVSDGVLTDSETFHITVTDPFPGHNQILCPPLDMLVPAGTVVEQPLQAISPDGNPVQFVLVSGPSYVTVSTTSSDPSNAAGILRAAPGPSEIGSAEVRVAATDGIATDTRALTLAVGDARALPDPEHPLFQGRHSAILTGRTPQSVAGGDLDGDGALDLVTANLSGSVTILRGTGSGGFERRDDHPFGGQPYSVAIGDLNGDGQPDLAVADSALDVVSILYATGECQFGNRLDLATPLRPAHVKLADWTADGALDMVVSDEGANVISFFRGRGDGTFDPERHEAVGHDPCYSDDGDFNGDGHLDVVVANEASNNVSVLLGRGDGTFEPHVTYPVGADPRSVEVGDLNGDGHLDLATANFEANTVSVLFGLGNGTFQQHSEHPCGTSPWSLAIGDLNDDGHLDVVTANVSDSSISILLGDGSGAFPDADPQNGAYLTRYVTLGDANGDGSQDIIAVAEGSNSAIVYLGDGDGGFLGPPAYPAVLSPGEALAGDWNRDGIPDLAVNGSGGSSGTDGSVQIFLGTGGGAIQGGQLLSGLQAGEMVTGDWNGDGAPDLATVCIAPHRLSILRGGGDGTFVVGDEYPLPAFPSGIAKADFGGDGREDLVITIREPAAILIYDGAGAGSFTPRAPLALSGTALDPTAADWNGDGRVDLAVPMIAPEQVLLLLGSEDGSLVLAPPVPVQRRPLEVVAGDFDRDNVLDLAVGTAAFAPAFPFGTVDPALEIRLGTGDGTFGASRVIPFEGPPTQILVVDANGDGRQDLAVKTGFHPTVALFLGLGNGDFAPEVVFGGGTSMDAADWNGDGRIDLAVTEFQMERVAVWLNRGTFPVVANRAPVADARGPYSGAAGVPIPFDGTGSSDPDGDALSMIWVFGDGASGSGSQPSHAYENEGVFQVTLTVGDGQATDTDATTATIGGTLEARAFTTSEDGAFRLFVGKPSHCLRLEPVSGSFRLIDVDFESMRLRSTGTGTVEEVTCISEKGAPLMDRDRNGVEELRLCFAVEDLRLLFASITGTSDVPVTVEGSLTDGRRFHAETTLRVIGVPGFPAAFVAPNPMNPAATLFVATSKEGFLRASLYDAAGRRVRRISDRALVPPGVHELRLDGRTDLGQDLPSGIYFYRVESAEGAARGRISIIR